MCTGSAAEELRELAPDKLGRKLLDAAHEHGATGEEAHRIRRRPGLRGRRRDRLHDAGELTEVARERFDVALHLRDLVSGEAHRVGEVRRVALGLEDRGQAQVRLFELAVEMDRAVRDRAERRAGADAGHGGAEGPHALDRSSECVGDGSPERGELPAQRVERAAGTSAGAIKLAELPCCACDRAIDIPAQLVVDEYAVDGVRRGSLNASSGR